MKITLSIVDDTNKKFMFTKTIDYMPHFNVGDYIDGRRINRITHETASTGSSQITQWKITLYCSQGEA